MTDDDKALVERLREVVGLAVENGLADQIVKAWLLSNIRLIEDIYGKSEDDPVDSNRDYQALLRVYDYISGPNG